MDIAYKPTTHGRAVMAACMDLEQAFHITRVCFGSGMVSEDTDLADVHSLVNYVSDGAVADRRHQDDRLFLTLQYANSEHRDVRTFYLSEFIVYCTDPETGEDTDLLYGTLGDYRQPVPAYNELYTPSVFQFPLTLVLSDEVQVSIEAPSGIATWSDVVAVAGQIKTEQLPLVIPVSGWVADTETGGAFAVHCDIDVAGMTASMIPLLAIHPASAAAAAACSLAPAAQSLTGKLRVYADTAPESALSATLAVLKTPSYITGGDGSTGLTGSAVAFAADADVENMLNDVYAEE